MVYKIFYIFMIVSLINKCKQLSGLFSFQANGRLLSYRYNAFFSSSLKNPREQIFRVIPIDSGKYFQIETFLCNEIIGVNQDKGKLTFVDKKNPTSY